MGLCADFDSRIVVIDNGGGNCKVGFAGEAAPRSVFPNCTAKKDRLYVGDMLLDCTDIAQLNLRRPVDRGYLVNWELQRDIWWRALRAVLKVDPSSSSLLMTEPLFNFPAVRQLTEEVVFEEFGFQAMFAAPAPYFSLRRHAALQPELPASQVDAVASDKALTGVVVDAGFSFTHAVPFFNGVPLLGGVRRLNLGGKALTNYLKELVCYRAFDMREDVYLLEHIKEALCFVSQDVQQDLRMSARGVRSPHLREYVLPDGIDNLRGYVRQPLTTSAAAATAAAAPGSLGPPPSSSSSLRRTPAAQSEQVLPLNNERFMVPETLFHPGDIGLQQAGLPETVAQAVAATPVALHPLLYSNVLLTGGVARCPGLRERFTRELRSLVPDDYDMHVHIPDDPALHAWQGASWFGTLPEYAHNAITKSQYEEYGAGNTGNIRT